MQQLKWIIFIEYYQLFSESHIAYGWFKLAPKIIIFYLFMDTDIKF